MTRGETTHEGGEFFSTTSPDHGIRHEKNKIVKNQCVHDRMGNEDDERLSIVYFFFTLRQLKSELAAAPAQPDQWSVDMMYSVQVTSSCKVPI